MGWHNHFNHHSVTTKPHIKLLNWQFQNAFSKAYKIICDVSPCVSDSSDDFYIDWLIVPPILLLFPVALRGEWWLVLPLSSTWQGFKVFPQIPKCTVQRSLWHLLWRPKPHYLIYRCNIVFSRRQELMWLDQWGSQALWITVCTMDSKNITENIWSSNPTYCRLLT